MKNLDFLRGLSTETLEKISDALQLDRSELVSGFREDRIRVSSADDYAYYQDVLNRISATLAETRATITEKAARASDATINRFLRNLGTSTLKRVYDELGSDYYTTSVLMDDIHATPYEFRDLTAIVMYENQLRRIVAMRTEIAQIIREKEE